LEDEGPFGWGEVPVDTKPDRPQAYERMKGHDDGTFVRKTDGKNIVLRIQSEESAHATRSIA
jgi:hypothetical protein